MCSARPTHGYQVEAITVHYEPLPQALPAVLANSITSYSLPETRREYLPRLRSHFLRSGNSIHEVREVYSDGRSGDFPVTGDGSFSFAVPLNQGGGVYTVVVWVRAAGGGEAIAASNVSIRVTEPGETAAVASFSSR